MFYNIHHDQATNTLNVSFGEATTVDNILKEANELACNLKSDVMGEVLRINGAMPVAVAFRLSAIFGNVVPAIAVFIPQEKKYVIASSTNPSYKIGDWLEN